MSKNSEMYVNDSKGYENEAKISYKILLDIFATTEGWSQEKLANWLEINSTTLRKYRREGSVSLYTTKRLSKLLDLNKDYFNGKLPITEDIEKTIRQKLFDPEINNTMNTQKCDSQPSGSRPLIQQLKDNSLNANCYNDYSLIELEELKQLLEKNLVMVTARAQIVRVVESSN